MLKKEFIKEIQENLERKGFNFSVKEVSEIHDTVFETLGSLIVKGETINIEKFGRFSSIIASRKDLYLEKTQGIVKMIKKFQIKFTRSNILNEAINKKN